MALFNPAGKNKQVQPAGSKPKPKGTPTTQTAKPAEPLHYTEVEQEGNIPYRGYVDHGVTVKPITEPEQNESQPAVEDLVTWDTPQDKEPAPIPVYTVPGPGQSGTVHRMFRTFYASASVATRMIIGRHDARSKVKISNPDSGETVWIGNDLSVSVMNGFPILAGQTLELNSNREVYAVIDPSAGPNVVAGLAILEEYTVQT